MFQALLISIQNQAKASINKQRQDPQNQSYYIRKSIINKSIKNNNKNNNIIRLNNTMQLTKANTISFNQQNSIYNRSKQLKDLTQSQYYNNTSPIINQSKTQFIHQNTQIPNQPLINQLNLQQKLTQQQQQIIKNTPQISHAYKTIPVKTQINNKYKTFVNWSYKDQIRKRQKAKKSKYALRQKSNSKDMIAAIMQLALNNNKKQDKKALVVQQLAGVKQERRQRFKKYNNPLFIIKHYMEKQQFKPSKQVTVLFQKLIQAKKQYEKHISYFDLNQTLQDIYSLMNTAVDYNQLRFLTLLILLAADICFQCKDFNRSFYYYNQARIASTYADLLRIKTEALLGMAKILMEMKKYQQCIVFLKKTLQYAWQTKNADLQLRIYDYIGTCYYYEGFVENSKYYHNRYIQCQLERQNSAFKKISSEMLQEYVKRVYALQRSNLNSLFIEYLNLPIKGFHAYPPSKILSLNSYSNYQLGQSPRKKRPIKEFDYQNFPKVIQLVALLLEKDAEFKFQIPQPDVQRNFVSDFTKYGRKKKDVDFTQTSAFHKLVGTKTPKINFEENGVYKFPLDIRINKRLNDKLDPQWWQKMVDKTRKQRAQKVGKLRDHTINSHESYNKYPDQKRRAQSLKNQKIKQSFNKTLLDFIDPLK